MRNCSIFLMEINQEKLYSLFLLATEVFLQESRRGKGIERGKEDSVGILNNLWGLRNRVGIEFSYRPARLHSLAELVL
jgi:hypothetical protein